MNPVGCYLWVVFSALPQGTNI